MIPNTHFWACVVVFLLKKASRSLWKYTLIEECLVCEFKQQTENQKFTIICITLFLFHIGICFALFQTRILCQRTIVFIAPIKTDHCEHIQWMSSQGHHRNGFQPGTCIFKRFSLYILFTLSAIKIQLHNLLLSLQSPILII